VFAYVCGVFFRKMSDPQKWGVYVTHGWWLMCFRPCERVCVAIYIYTIQHIEGKSVFNTGTRDINNFVSHTSWHASHWPPKKTCCRYVCVWKTGQERERAEWEQGNVSAKQSEMELERTSETMCVGLHIIISHVRVRVTLSTEDTLIIYICTE